MSRLYRNSLISAVLILSLCLSSLVCMPSDVVQAKEYPWGSFGTDNITKPQASPQINGGPPPGICIDNGIIDICWFRETSGHGWFYPGTIGNVSVEVPLLAYGANMPRPLFSGTVTKFYPATGVPDTWYEAIVELDLDEWPPLPTNTPDVEVHREIMVPSGGKCFFARYTIRNISGHPLNNLRFFELIDYDLYLFWLNEAGYRDMACDFVWAHYPGENTYAGFSGSIPSVHHDAGDLGKVSANIFNGTLSDSNSVENTDVAVAMEWHLGYLPAGSTTAPLTITYCFADSFEELLGRFAPLLPPPPAAPTQGGAEGASTGGVPAQNLRTANLHNNIISINPSQTVVNRPVTITTNVINEGSETGSTRLALKINGQVEQTQVVNVGPGGSRPVKFTVTKAEPGTYTVIIGSQRASFLVTGDTAGGTSAEGSVIAIMLLVLLAAAVVIVLAFSLGRRST